MEGSIDESEYTIQMYQRWASMVKNLAETDRNDLLMESLVFGMKGAKKQQQPEFSQSMFLRIRSNEEAFALSNYLENAEEVQKASKKKLISEFDRSYAVQKIFDLHMKKEYKIETLFVAVSIMDRYLHQIGYQTYPVEKICHLAVTSLLMAAKLEQPIQPSFNRMINML